MLDHDDVELHPVELATFLDLERALLTEDRSNARSAFGLCFVVAVVLGVATNTVASPVAHALVLGGFLVASIGSAISGGEVARLAVKAMRQARRLRGVRTRAMLP